MLRVRTAIVLVITVGLLFLAVPQLGPSRAHASYSTFSSPQAIELSPDQSDYPSALVASDGTLWVAWQQYFEFGDYETFTASQGWSGVQTLPTGANSFVISPSLAQFRNGSIILLWSGNNTGNWNIFYKLYYLGVWHSTVQLTTGTTFNDYFPHAAVSTNSTVYVFWQRNFATTSNIYYKVLKGSTWLPEKQLPPSGVGNTDVSPTSLATYDGKIWTAWSRLNPSTLNYTTYYSSSSDGNNWSGGSAGILLPTIANQYDIQPSLVQDRNGTILIFFSREQALSTTVFQQKLWYKYTVDGSTWSPDTQLTSYGNVNSPLNDFSPTVVQSRDQSIYVFYSTNYPIGNAFNIYYVKSLGIYPIHNVVMTQVQSGIYGFQKSISTVLVTLSNVGDYAETVQLTITAKNVTTITIVSAVFETVQIGKTVSFTFSWNTTLVPQGMYTITATYPTVSGQSVLASGGDHLLYKTITILPPLTPRGCHMRVDCPV